MVCITKCVIIPSSVSATEVLVKIIPQSGKIGFREKIFCFKK